MRQIIVGCLFCLAALMLCSFPVFADANADIQPAAQEQSACISKTFALHYINCDELMPLLVNGAGEKTAPALPEGIIAIMGMKSLNTLVVKATSQAALDKLEARITQYDKPVNRALFEAMIIEMPVSEVLFLVNGWTAAKEKTLPILVGSFRDQISTLLRDKKAKMVSAPRMLIAQGATGELCVGETDSQTKSGVRFNYLALNSDQSISFSMETFGDNPMNALLRLRDGQSMLINCYPKPTKAKKTDKGTYVVIVVTPTIVNWANDGKPR